MTVLIDTGVLYADHDRDAARHDAATRALNAVYRGAYGQPYLTEYIFDEAITVTRRRTGRHAAAVTMSERLRGAGEYPTAFDLLRVDRATFDDAIDCFTQYDDQSLSFTDATSIAVCERHDLDQILSFDDDFDGLIPRLDPAEA